MLAISLVENYYHIWKHVFIFINRKKIAQDVYPLYTVNI